MEHRIIFATGNAGKMKEVRMILGELGIPVLSMKEAGIAADIVENGKSFEENAVIKAETIRDLTADGDLVLADDSGLEIDYLDGAPGIYSARFMGEDTCYTIKNTALVEKLAGVPEEEAHGPVCLCDRMRISGRPYDYNAWRYGGDNCARDPW